MTVLEVDWDKNGIPKDVELVRCTIGEDKKKMYCMAEGEGKEFGIPLEFDIK